jgi:hypothetical protein
MRHYRICDSGGDAKLDSLNGGSGAMSEVAIFRQDNATEQ